LTLLVSACDETGTTVPNIPICSVAGNLGHGGDCAYTLSDEQYEMDVDQFLDFLEPQEAKPNPLKPGEMIPERGAAVCMSTDSWAKLKTFSEQACRILGSKCTKEVQQQLQQMSARMTRLQRRVAGKKIIRPILKP
jgi:hypothetical protein